MDINSSKMNKVLYRLGITITTIEEWMILQRSTFDAIVDREPYFALQLFFNWVSGEYLIRVWGRTHSRGEIAISATELESLCNKVFIEGPACCPGQIGNGATESLVSVDYPFQRKISPDCAVVHHPQTPGSDHVPIDICSKCSFDTKGKMDVKEEPSDTYVSLLKDPLTYSSENTMQETTIYNQGDLKEEHSDLENDSSCTKLVQNRGKRKRKNTQVPRKVPEPINEIPPAPHEK